VLDALGAVERICDTGRTVVMGVCAGGIIASVMAAHLAAAGQQDRLACFPAGHRLDTANAGTSPRWQTGRWRRRHPVDLSRVGVDSCIVAGIADHITPWQNCYRSTQPLGGQSRFILSTSAHIAALVNPPGSPKAGYQAGKTTAGSPADWLGDRCGADKPASAEPGGGGLRPLAAAPGTYVFDT
jgi:poly(3-hydroxyalkanoate) synthetase